MTRILGLLNPFKKGKVDCGRLEGGGRYPLLNNFRAHLDVVSLSHYCSPYSVSRGRFGHPLKLLLGVGGLGSGAFD